MDTKKLRQKILDLAIRGKLVPQDPNDEPAAVLLERIRAEKERLIAEGKIKCPKKSKASSSESHYQQLFQLPHNWEWIELGEFTYDLQYGTSEKSLSKGDVSVLRMGNLTRIGTIDYSNLVYTCNKDDIAKFELKKGDLLFNRTNSSEWVGKTSLYDGKIPAIYAGYLIKIRAIVIDSKFLCMYMCSEYYRDWCLQVKTDAVNQSNINAQKLSKLYCPIPPLKEQRRIVSVFYNIIAILTQIEFSKSILISTITGTKSKILELAMQGKLVPQDPSDEPAADMLKRINPKAKIITDNPHSWNIPSNWMWISVKDVFRPMERKLPNGDQFLYIDIDSVDNKNNTVVPKPIPVKTAPCRASRKTIKGDIVFSMVRPYLKNIAIVPYDDCIASTGFYVLSCTRSINPEFAFIIAISDFFVKGLNVFMKGDNSPSINKDHVENYVIPLPPLNEQKRIVAKIEELYHCIDRIEASLQS